MQRIAIHKDEIAAFCKRNHIRRMALFGSVLRDDFTPASDVDVLVEFEPGRTIGFAFIDIQDELAKIFGRQVDMHTFKSVERNRNRLLRNRILDSAEALYEQPR